jgi:hypothetical protein
MRTTLIKNAFIATIKEAFMKSLGFFVATMIVWSITVYAGDGGNTRTERQNAILNAAEMNLAATLKTVDGEFLESVIASVTDIKRTYSDKDMSLVMIPLMRILRNHPDSNFRILAAMALTDIGHGTGVYAVKEAARFDKNKTVRHICMYMSGS